jgi:NAD(P)H-hydrate epimerase
LRGISRKLSRGVDRRATEVLGIPSLCLMENAGCGAASVVMSIGYDRSQDAVCVCGPGNNGGDGMVVARHLSVAGFRVRVVLIPARDGAPGTPDARTQFGILRAMAIPVSVADPPFDLKGVFPGAGILVDGLFGTGLTRAIAGPAADLVGAMNASGVPIVALDLPSGLDCDTGEPLGPTIRATATATFVAPKLGFSSPTAAPYLGRVHVVGIGAPFDESGN